MSVERIGRIKGRWVDYRLIVNGVDVGNVQRTNGGWYAGSPEMVGTVKDSREGAESALIIRAQLTCPALRNIQIAYRA